MENCFTSSIIKFSVKRTSQHENNSREKVAVLEHGKYPRCGHNRQFPRCRYIAAATKLPSTSRDYFSSGTLVELIRHGTLNTHSCRGYHTSTVSPLSINQVVNSQQPGINMINAVFIYDFNNKILTKSDKSFKLRKHIFLTDVIF